MEALADAGKRVGKSRILDELRTLALVWRGAWWLRGQAWLKATYPIAVARFRCAVVAADRVG